MSVEVRSNELGSKVGLLRYVLITPAWNEEKHLEGTIRSVAEQTLLPIRWVVVSDGSIDRTDEIVKSHARHYPWLHLLRLERDPERSFAGKARAVNAAYEALRGLDFDLVGNLDADISVPPDYYEFLVRKFYQIPDLGVAGTPFVEEGEGPGSHSYGHAAANLEHVSGATQLFRRRCFEDVGGYTPLKDGGVDWVAVTTARMLGWKTRTFVEKACTHHRLMGTADRKLIKARFRHGRVDYAVGSDPVWQVARCAFQMGRKPVVVGGMALMLGYTWEWLRGGPSQVSRELRAFHRSEQRGRLRVLVAGAGKAFRRTRGGAVSQ